MIEELNQDNKKRGEFQLEELGKKKLESGENNSRAQGAFR
jgi:hypothetical protein